ncbi:T9SS C-terminal target domain-containing protein [candidate division KSB1 bacterium]|nr:immune inhibitor A [candidate division KSB1 bacterium]RQW05394.1 MAG: T9SS C-terminal target domain-containing protein [candidate division KSB1 bacterium]
MKLKLAVVICLGAFSFAYAESRLDEIREAIHSNNATWRAAENWVTRLSRDELSQLCGTIIAPAPDAQSCFITLPPVSELPSELDWRENNGNWVTSVKNQGGCGSCWNFSATAQVEAWWHIFNNNPQTNLDLSEQFVLSCSDAGTCNGGRVELALSFYQTNGVPLESCLPYQATDYVFCSEACPDWQEQAVTIPGWGYVTLEEPIVENIKQALLYHPVSASYTVYEDFLYYDKGVYEHVWGNDVGGHAILIVGWNDAEQSWICKNSWDTDWGENGYFRIKWGDSGMGQYVPFIYDELTSAALELSPATIELTLVSGDSAITPVRIKNVGDGQLYFSLIDYAVPIAFFPDPTNAYDGSSWWCADPEAGGYKDHWLQYLDTPVIDLSGTSEPQLAFQTYWAIEPPEGTDPPWDGWDGANVWISTDSGATYTVIHPSTPDYTCQSLWAFGEPEQGWNMGPNIAGWAGKSDGWNLALFDLSAFASRQVIIRFAFASDLAFCTADDPTLLGFFVDEILVSDGTQVLFFDDADDITTMHRQGFGIQAADWMGFDSPGGLLGPGESVDAYLSISTKKLAVGAYEGLIEVSSNDTTTLAELPVHLTVASADYDLGVNHIYSPEKLPLLTGYSPVATIHNNGSTNASDFDVYCEMTAFDSLIYSESRHIESLPPDLRIRVTFPDFVPLDTCSVQVKVFIQNFSNDQFTYNDSLTSHFSVTSTIDDFETANPLWIAEGGWAVTSEHAGYQSDYAAHVNGGTVPYEANMDAVFTYSQHFNVEQADSILLSYWAWTFTEDGQDNCYLEVSTDSLVWTAVDTLTGMYPSFIQHHVPISPVLPDNANKLWLRFRFTSNATEQFVGVFIDDIAISATRKKIDTQIYSNALTNLDWRLDQNYPNPFNPFTTIRYSLAKPSHVTISIFSLTGRRIETLMDEPQQAGWHGVTWRPQAVASGVYIYKMQAKTETGETFQALKKMLFIK